MIRREILSDRWPQKLLGEVAEFLDHLRIPVKEKDRRSGPFPYYGANGQQGTIDGYLFDEPLLLLAEDGGHFDDPTRRIAYTISGKAWVNNHAHVIRPKSDMDLSFLCRHLEFYDVRPFVTGTTRGKLTKTAAARIPVLVPPLAEQRRIAAMLDKADAVRRKRREAVGLLDEFLRSVFLEMFGDPVRNEREWEVRTLRELVDPDRPITYGILKPGPHTPDGVPYVRVVDMVDGTVRTSMVKRTTRKIAGEYRRSTLRSGDILLSIRGHVGRVAVAPTELTGGNITQDTARLAIVGSHMSSYVRACIASEPMQRLMQRFVRGVAVRGINLGDVKELPIPIPGAGLRERFARLLEQGRELRYLAVEALDHHDALFNSLVQPAFG